MRSITPEQIRIAESLQDVPDHKIEALFREMGIEIDLKGPPVERPRAVPPTSEEMMFDHLFGQT